MLVPIRGGGLRYYMRDRPDKDSTFSQNYKPGHTSSVRVVNANNKPIGKR